MYLFSSLNDKYLDMWWWIRHSMCIGDMRFCLENTGKIQIEYIDVFPHIFEVEASQCGGHSKRPLTRHSQRPCLNANLHFPSKYAESGFHRLLFSGFWPSARFATGCVKAFKVCVRRQTKKNIFSDRDLEWLFGTRRGLKKVDVVHVKRVVSKFLQKGYRLKT